MLEIYILKINKKIDTSLINKVLHYLSFEKQKKIKKFRSYDDARRSITAELLVRSLVMEKLKITNDEIAFGENAYQKPYLKSTSKFEYNVSHSGEWVVCAIDCHPVGIDVEQIMPINFDIAKNYFTSEEYGNLIQCEASEKLTYFYKLWTLKESYIKAIGKGLSISLDSFSFHMDVGDQTIMVKEGIYPLYYLTTFPLEPDYVLSVCAARNYFSKPIIIREEELIASFS